MRIPYKAVYHLLDRFYARRSDLGEYLDKEIASEIFKGSILFAHKNEDYQYLNVMIEDKETYTKECIFFTNMKIQEHPIVLIKDNDLTFMEFALLYTHCDIHIEEFKSVVKSQFEDKEEGTEKSTKFHSLVTHVMATPSSVDADKGR